MAGDLARIGFLRELADGESPHRSRWELAGAGSDMIDIHIPAAVRRPSTVSIYYNEYFEALGGSYNYTVVFRTQPATLRENDQSSTVTEDVIP